MLQVLLLCTDQRKQPQKARFFVVFFIFLGSEMGLSCGEKFRGACFQEPLWGRGVEQG